MKFNLLPSMAAVLAATLALTGQSQAQSVQGVSANEILIGTIQDFSGPLAGYGKQMRFGMQMRVDEINDKGGIHGRKLKLLLEDSGYDPKKAALAAQKLVNSDKVFLIAGHMGTPTNEAAMPIQFEKNVMNFFPVTGAATMFEPVSKLKFAFWPPYHRGIQLTLPKLIKDTGAKRICSIHQDDDYGLEVHSGVEAGLKKARLELTDKTTFKRGATDFSSQVAKLKASNCDLVVLGSVIRETVGIQAEARKTGFTPVFLGSAATASELIHKLGGEVVEGSYAVMTFKIPYLDDASETVKNRAKNYKTKFNEEPGGISALAYTIVDNLGLVLQKNGPNLSTESLAATLEGMTLPADIFGSPPLKFSPSNHLGNDQVRLGRIQNGRWVPVSDYLTP